MKKKRNKYALLFGLVIYLVLSLATRVALGEPLVGLPFRYIDLLKFHSDLRNARERWETTGPSHYQAKIQEGHFIDEAGYDCYLQRDPIVVFKDGKAIDGDKWADCQEAYDELTVEKIFDQIEQEVTGQNPFLIYWQVEFDPDYGYVSSYYVRCVDSVAISSDRCQEALNIQDFGWKTFGFTEFLVVEDSSQ